MTPRLLVLQGAAAAVSLFGYFVITRGGGFGAGRGIATGEALALLSVAALYGWWLAPVAASTSGVRGATLALAVIDVLWVLLGQGVGGLMFCALPFCPDAAPFTDLIRYGSLLLGAAAGWTAWRAYRAAPGPTQWAPVVTAVVLIVVSFALQGANAKFP